MKTLTKRPLLLLPIVILLASCEPEVQSEYQEFYNKNYSNVLYILSGTAECLDAFSPGDERIFTNLQTVGHSSGSEAWPSDLLIKEENMYALNSGQNVIEKYDAATLDYRDKLYLKNGFNPLVISPIDNSDKAVISGFASDELVVVNLETFAETISSDFTSVFEAVVLPEGSHGESKAAVTDKNATGDNHKRSPTGIAINGNTVYVSNVRYDSSILLTDGSGNLAEYDGANVRAAGSFREGTLSLFQLDASHQLSLTKEINLNELFSNKYSGKEYFPGDGLNPQSLFVLNGKLHIICTGTNGGEKRVYSENEYLPKVGSIQYSIGDEVPGTNPDDGLVLILDITDPQNPILENSIAIGGSPVGFRSSMDKSRNVFYLAGVGGVQSYNYVSEQALRNSANPILAGNDPSFDYYSYLLFKEDVLYISNFTNNSLNRVQLLNDGTYNLLESKNSSGGPGAMAFYSR